MVIFKKDLATLAALLLFSMTLISTQQVQFTDASTACVGYQSGVNTITVTCDASFLDVVQAINDPEILEQEEERSEEHTSELQSRQYLVCRLLLEKKKNKNYPHLPTELLRTLH